MDITPDKQNIDALFSKTTYYIDFYQRDYKWSDPPVKRLLEDILFKFNSQYDPDLEADEKNIIAKYSWYYLNTYVTNQSDGKVYVVDGQQRLTTITLVLIKLLHLCQQHNSDLEEWVKSKIVGVQGRRRQFWMNHEAHKQAMQNLLDGKELTEIDVSSGITAKNMVNNYKTIAEWLDKEIKDQHRLETFIFFFLQRLVMINLAVAQTDVSMVFEVINDRGVKLKPYEILKGKLLGQIDKNELENLQLNELWEGQVRQINEFDNDKADEFFRYFLKGKFVGTRAEGTKFDGAYHRALFTEEGNKHLKLKHNPRAVKNFLQHDFKYFSSLYLRILKYAKDYSEEQPFIKYNAINGMDTQMTLILSSCSLKDGAETEKIKAVSKELDRFYTLLQLQGAYDSNKINESIYKISKQIRGKEIAIYRSVFDEHLQKEISTKKGTEVEQPFTYAYFKNVGYADLNIRFIRYFLARIEQFIADGIHKKMKHTLYDLVQKRQSKHSFHIEHILAKNEENYQYFMSSNGNGEPHFDEEIFTQQRNRLGGLLLLKGRDNISSNNEVYAKKLDSYADSLYWNITLRKDTYKSKLDIKDFIKAHDLKMRPIDTFDQVAVEERHRLLFDMVNIIWK